MKIYKNLSLWSRAQGVAEVVTCGCVEHADNEDGDAGQVQVHPGHLQDFDDVDLLNMVLPILQ